eukprot:6193025-Pleurochrysis_carterae.AAC.1
MQTEGNPRSFCRDGMSGLRFQLLSVHRPSACPRHDAQCRSPVTPFQLQCKRRCGGRHRAQRQRRGRSSQRVAGTVAGTNAAPGQV